MRPVVLMLTFAGAALAVALSILFVQPAVANSNRPCDESKTAEVHERVLQYTNQSAPDSVLFLHFLQSVYIQEASRLDPAPYLAPGLNPKSNAEYLVEYFVNLYADINNETIEISKKVLDCKARTREFVGDRVDDMFFALDDLRLAVYSKHLAIANAELIGQDVFDLLAAIRNSPSTFSQSLPDYSEILSQYDGQPKSAVSEYCDMLDNGFTHIVSEPSLERQ